MSKQFVRLPKQKGTSITELKPHPCHSVIRIYDGDKKEISTLTLRCPSDRYDEARQWHDSLTVQTILSC